jgi:hypothetical protein
MENPIPVRIPKDILDKIDSEGKRGTVINRILRGHYEDRQSSWTPDNAAKFKAKSTPVGGKIEIKLPQRWVVAHDVNNCRLYGCLMCKAAKENNGKADSRSKKQDSSE